jgi:hypothetical protein
VVISLVTFSFSILLDNCFCENCKKLSSFYFLKKNNFLIGCFSSYLIWCGNPSCPILIGGHKGAGLHQLLGILEISTRFNEKS